MNKDMKIAVCVKYFDGEINPFDECALECALSVSDDVTVISMGPESVAERIVALTRLGVKRVILLSDAAFAGADTLATSRALSCAVRKINPDLVICGRQSIDGDTAQVGPELSAMLGYNLITNVMRFGTDVCETRFGTEAVKLPSVITVERINRLRFPSIRSKLGSVEIWDADKLGGDKSMYGVSGSPTHVLKTFKSSRGERHCKFIDKSQLLPLIEKLQLSDKVHESVGVLCSTPLKNVWAIGREVEKKASEIAKSVTVIEEKDPVKIAELIQEHRPETVLWAADLWGRKNAPIAAALLNTGLCADCTNLETDGKELYMYRPARSGDLYAKIISKTLPKMATVRVSAKTDDFYASAGRGVQGKFAEFKEFALYLGAKVCVSRPLVDSNEAPYDMQVGLTGKNVSPAVYLAVGISGAVQHVCAIENAGTVIAVNPDKKADIFKYSDYGIVCKFEDLIKN